MMVECSICWEEAESAGASRLQCGHSFHAACLAEWLARSLTCPLCRRATSPKPVDMAIERAERDRLAAAGLTIPPYFAGLKFRGQKWYFGTQRSTYELLVKCRLWLGRDDAWLTQTFATVYHHPARYGSFADNNAWSPTYTSEQLQRVCELIRQA